MPLTTTDIMLKKAQEGHYAVGAFNAENMEMVQAIIEAAEETNSPVIIKLPRAPLNMQASAFTMQMQQQRQKKQKFL